MSSPVEDAQQALHLGDLNQALKLLQDGVRAQPANVKLRIFLFQLLSVQGQWARALNQLKVCGEMDASTLPMVNTYREALQCEAVREAVFKGQTTPIVMGQPQTWVAHLVEALLADSRGEVALATHLRAQALADAPTTAGTLNGQPFAWVADADSRLGPVLEVIVNGRYGWVPFASLARVTFDAPEDLRDLVWMPATLDFPNGGSTVALVPSRYAPMPEGADGMLLLARRTEWEAIGEAMGEAQYRGLGQRLLTTDTAELGLLDVRELVLHTEANTATEGAADAAASAA
jgi:type VI secretion system protein ImpE